jgi:hypothetical protein
MKIDLQKILHPMIPDIIGFAEIRFAKKAGKMVFFGILSLDVGIG